MVQNVIGTVKVTSLHPGKYFRIHEVAIQSAGVHQATATGLLMTADFDLSYLETYPRIACTGFC
jgi:hypothetical protein